MDVVLPALFSSTPGALPAQSERNARCRESGAQVAPVSLQPLLAVTRRALRPSASATSSTGLPLVFTVQARCFASGESETEPMLRTLPSDSRIAAIRGSSPVFAGVSAWATPAHASATAATIHLVRIDGSRSLIETQNLTRT